MAAILYQHQCVNNYLLRSFDVYLVVMNVVGNAYHIAFHQLLDVNYCCSNRCRNCPNKNITDVCLKLVIVIFFRFVWNVAKQWAWSGHLISKGPRNCESLDKNVLQRFCHGCAMCRSQYDSAYPHWYSCIAHYWVNRIRPHHWNMVGKVESCSVGIVKLFLRYFISSLHYIFSRLVLPHVCLIWNVYLYVCDHCVWIAYGTLTFKWVTRSAKEIFCSWIDKLTNKNMLYGV